MTSPIQKRPARRPRSNSVQSRRRNPRPSGTNPTPAPGDPRILDAVRDQHGAPWIWYGTGKSSIWFAVVDLISAPALLFQRLARHGIMHVTRGSQDALKKQVEGYAAYREAWVASRPGWVGNHYAFGDGTIISPKGKGSEVIIAFDSDPRFTPRGTLAEWQKTVGPFVRHQPLPHFAVAYAFVGPMLRFLPRGQLNPQVELVGDQETGKTTIGVLAVSIWGGDRDSDVGAGESYDTTLNSFDDLKRFRRDSLLFLDESNLVGAPAAKRSEFIEDSIFKNSANRGKRRMGDPSAPDIANVAFLSTTNTPLKDLVVGDAARIRAMRSRLITITLASDRPYGVFDTLPEDHASALKATEALQAAADECWGAPAREFVGKLVRRADRDEARLQRRIARRIDRARRSLPDVSGSARVKKTLALVAAAAGLARDWGVIPKSWGSPRTMMAAIVQLIDGQADAPASPIERVRAYVEQHQSDLVDVDHMKNPMSKSDFDACPGFLRVRDGRKEVLIPGKQFRDRFSEHEAIMDALSRDGLAQTEGGRQKKHSIKAPRAICTGGRVYCILLT